MDNRLRLRVMGEWIRSNASGIAWIVRYPPSLRKAWIFVMAWAAALAAAALAVTLEIVTGRFVWLVGNLAFVALDSYMLWRAVAGLMWRRSLGRGRRRAGVG